MRTTTSQLKSFELSEQELNIVSGGTPWPNTYRKSTYHAFGINTHYNVSRKDEFYFNGILLNHDQANEIVKLGNKVLDMINAGHSGSNKIGTTEPAFIRAFNMELKLTYGSSYLWDGTPGCDV